MSAFCDIISNTDYSLCRAIKSPTAALNFLRPHLVDYLLLPARREISSRPSCCADDDDSGAQYRSHRTNVVIESTGKDAAGLSALFRSIDDDDSSSDTGTSSGGRSSRCG